MPTVELHHPNRGPVKVRESVVDRWIADGWTRGHEPEQDEPEQDEPADDGDTQEE